MQSAVMYGAGSIGRGFIAQLFSESGYETVFVDIDRELVRLLNERGRYPLRFVGGGEGETETVVDRVRGVCAQDADAVAEEISRASLMATSVGKNALPLIAGNIAAGLRLRWRKGNGAPLNIIVCENMIGANAYLRGLVAARLDGAEKALLCERVGMVETCIGRNVPVMTPALTDGDPLRVVAEAYAELPVHGADFVGALPPLRHMTPHTPFGYFIRRKLFLYNMAHALTAYLGALAGDEMLAEAIRRPDVKYIASGALREAAVALSRAYRAELDGLLGFCADLTYRFGNRSLGVTVARTGADPVRKLSPGDRLAGSAGMCLEQGVFPVFIAVGIAAGYCFDARGDPSAGELQAYLEKNGAARALKKFSGLDAGDPLAGHVVELYEMLRGGSALAAVIEKAESRAFAERVGGSC
jgi:mannitol-1-phosphate 5-dehydrogenase